MSVQYEIKWQKGSYLAKQGTFLAFNGKVKVTT